MSKNILHLSERPLSSAPYRLMQSQREAGYTSRLILHRAMYSTHSNIAHPYDILLQDDSPNKEKRNRLPFSIPEIYRLFQEADVLHFHNYIKDQFLFRLFPDLKDFLKRKKVVLQFHSPRLSLKNASKDLKNPDLDEALVVAQYQARQFPECKVVPNVVPINDERHLPKKESNDKPVVCFSPSNTKLKGWNNKGADIVSELAQDLSRDMIFYTIKDTPFNTCLELKQDSDMCIDEIVTGSYHMSSLESLSMGLVVFNGMDDECKKSLSEWTGQDEHPMISVKDKKELFEELCYYRDHPEERIKKGKESRAFMEKFWSPERLTEKYYKPIYGG